MNNSVSKFQEDNHINASDSTEQKKKISESTIL